ncbi:MAG: hypothetical protein V3U57_08350 [Robiginitomaculum sp.]
MQQQPPTPVESATINQLKFSNVEVNFSEDRSIPEVYDKAVKSLIDGEDGKNSMAATAFQKYVDANGGAGNEDDQLAERYLEYRIGEEVKSGLSASLNGTNPIDIIIKIDQVQTPNPATMFLIGEIKSIRYDLDIVDSETKDVIIDFTKPSTPFVAKSAGAGGGLLGMALRIGKNTKITDLEQLATAVSNEVRQILLGPVVNTSVLDKIRVADKKK